MRDISYFIVLIISLLLGGKLCAQQQGESDITISAKAEKNGYRFEATNKPALQQIAGAPEAHYSYFWEFGDGEFSTEETPLYAYRDSGEVKVNVALTNNYGSGGAPRIKSRRLKVNSTSSTTSPITSPLSKKEGIGILTNSSPRPGDQLVCVISYQNNEMQEIATNGHLYLFFNEKEFEYNNFKFEESRAHHGEKFYEGYLGPAVTSVYAPANMMYASRNSVQALPPHSSIGIFDDKIIREAKEKFADVLSWEYQGLQPGEVRNIFVTLQAATQMIKDTSTTISIRGIMIPDPPGSPKTADHSMVIRSSHDPNELKVSERKINKRTIRKKGLTYTIKFQNSGKGSAGNIKITQALPDFLDPSTITVLDYYPKSRFCVSGDSVNMLSCLDTTRNHNNLTWNFRNIYLPGIRQKDRENRKATHGYITYNIKPYSKLKSGLKLSNHATIVFDRNKPIQTNRVVTHVVKNYGYTIRIGTFDITYGLKGLSAAVGVSPFYSKKIYYQPEVGATVLEYEGRTTVQTGIIVGNDGNGDPLTGDRKIVEKIRASYLDIIPVQFRYSLFPFLNIGGGAQVAFLLNAIDRTITTRDYTTQSFNVPPFPPREEVKSMDFIDNFPDKMEYNFFVDIQGGWIKKGPGLGIRANYRASNRPQDDRANEIFMQLYLQYRF